MQHGAALARESGEPALAEAVASGDTDGLPPRLRALLGYAVKLTRVPALVTEEDVGALRAAGLDDRAIVDANQVVALSIRQRNAALRVSAGVLNARVSLGLVLSLAAMASS